MMEGNDEFDACLEIRNLHLAGQRDELRGLPGKTNQPTNQQLSMHRKVIESDVDFNPYSFSELMVSLSKSLHPWLSMTSCVK